MIYLPESVLLNHVFIPFHQLPVKQTYNCSQQFTSLEIGPNGFTSVINLSLKLDDGSFNPVFPYIDLGKFDPDTKDWLWFDSEGFPFRLVRDTVNSQWNASSKWDFGQHAEKIIVIDPPSLSREENGKELGFYTNATCDSETIKMYTGMPIIVTINGEVLKDRTIYGQATEYNLTNLIPEQNKEFYYDSSTNRIYTNQNLNEFEPGQIRIHLYTVSNEVSVKCRLKANQGKDAYITPTVDYYILKLNGQYLRG